MNTIQISTGTIKRISTAHNESMVIPEKSSFLIPEINVQIFTLIISPAPFFNSSDAYFVPQTQPTNKAVNKPDNGRNQLEQIVSSISKKLPETYFCPKTASNPFFNHANLSQFATLKAEPMPNIVMTIAEPMRALNREILN